MRKFVKGIVIGTVAAVFGATAVFAAGTGNDIGSGTGSSTVQGSSVSSSVPGGVSTACPWCREEGHCYQDLDNDGICDYPSAYTGGTFTGHHGQGSYHHSFRSGHYNFGQGCSSGCHGICR